MKPAPGPKSGGCPYALRGKKRIAIVGLEPSCLLTLRDELLVMGPGRRRPDGAGQAPLLEEFLAREAQAGQLDALKARLRPMSQPGACCTAIATRRPLVR